MPSQLSRAKQQEIYLRLTLPLESKEHEHLFKCVTTIYPKRDGEKAPTKNHGARTFEELSDLIKDRETWAQGRADVYLAQGTFKIAGSQRPQDGSYWITRTGANTATFNGLFLDIDAGEGKEYATTEDVLVALAAFEEATGLDNTMVVSSGSGGRHAYFNSLTPMPKDQWQPLADAMKRACEHHGLKTDPVVTADAARILRIPGTFNHKHTPPRPVEIDMEVSKFKRHTPERLAEALSQFMVAQKRQTGTGPAASVSRIGSNFTEGIEERNAPKRSIDEIAVNCPAVRLTLETGGAGKPEPQWFNDVYLASWTTDPHDAAHRLSQGHEQYTEAETEKKLDEQFNKVKANPNLGWPKCSSFNHKACLTCDLRKLDKSPIHFAQDVARGEQPMQPKQDDDLLPDGYFRNDHNHIMMIRDGKRPLDLFGYAFLDAWVDAKTGKLVVKFVSGGDEYYGSIDPSHVTPAACAGAWATGTSNRIVVPALHHKQVLGLEMAWIKHLQDRKKFITADGFGWHGDDFVFGDEVFTPDGAKAAYRGDTAMDEYRKVGEAQPWLDAMEIIYGNPTLEVMVASAFAAPLVTFVSADSLMLSIFSYESAYGKTTSMRIAQAVWGKPGKINQASDTENYVLQTLSKLRNLPSYWDEIQLPKTKGGKTDVSIFFRAMPGRDKNRLNRDAKAKMQTDEARTIFTLASNKSLASAVVENTEGTDAGGLRVFELHAEPLLQGGIDTEGLIGKLYENYGVAGAAYAQKLVAYKKKIPAILGEIDAQLHAVCQFTSKERFWRRLMVAMIGGAHLANAAKLTRFDIGRLQRRLIDGLETRRADQTNAQVYSLTGPDSAELALNEMIADCSNRHLIETSFIPIPQPGQPQKPKPVNMANWGLMGEVRMQVGHDDGRVLITQRAFHEWMRAHNYEPQRILQGLRGAYNVTGPTKRTLGSGLEWFKGTAKQRQCYELTPLNRSPSAPSASSDSPALKTPSS